MSEPLKIKWVIQRNKADSEAVEIRKADVLPMPPWPPGFIDPYPDMQIEDKIGELHYNERVVCSGVIQCDQIPVPPCMVTDGKSKWLLSEVSTRLGYSDLFTVNGERWREIEVEQPKSAAQ